MIVGVYNECWFDSSVHGNSIMTHNLWKRKDIFKRCGIEMNIKWKQTKWCSLCVISTATVGVDSCSNIYIPNVLNKRSVINATDVITQIK